MTGDDKTPDLIAQVLAEARERPWRIRPTSNGGAILAIGEPEARDEYFLQVFPEARARAIQLAINAHAANQAMIAALATALRDLAALGDAFKESEEHTAWTLRRWAETHDVHLDDLSDERQALVELMAAAAKIARAALARVGTP